MFEHQGLPASGDPAGPWLLEELPPEDTVERPATALDRTRQALQREESAHRRDLGAVGRDQAADARDRAAINRETAAPTRHADNRVRRLLAGMRTAAARDRAAAAADRERAAADRAAAAVDRRQSRLDLGRAHLDGLTGVYSRVLGEEILRNDVARAHRLRYPLTLAFLGVDDLAGLNDRQGHAAGDLFLLAVADALRLRMRSYDPVVRMGGDEFVCALAGSGAHSAMRRLTDVRAALARSHPDTSISVGVAELEPRETLEELTKRGAGALDEAKHERRS